MSTVPILESLEEFLFLTPLYSQSLLEKNSLNLKRIYARGTYNLDGHCPYCHKKSTFKLRGSSIPNGDPWDKVASRFAHDEISLECARDDSHVIYFTIRINNLVVEKIGQYPSLADIANDESKQYRSVLTKDDSSEFHKAIGLAAHGVGIGSYVYLRRIFEHLIIGRFEEFKAQHNWKDEDFYKLRMGEKIDFLKDHLPAFLVKNKGIYSVLSLGIHELSEEKCLAFFNVIKNSIVIILEEDKKNKEEAAQLEKLTKAIASFSSSNT